MDIGQGTDDVCLGRNFLKEGEKSVTEFVRHFDFVLPSTRKEVVSIEIKSGVKGTGTARRKG